MVETARGVSFPVVFYDGERDTNIGYVPVSAATEFKSFQSILSKKIGISSHHFTVYLADYQESSSRIRRRIPITGKVNFGAISGEKSSFFLVVLKRSKRERRRKGHENDGEYCYPLTTKTKTQQLKKNNPPENVMLLRRNAGIENEPITGFISPLMGRFEYEQRIRKLQFEKEKYLINMGLSEFSVGRGGGRNGVVDGEMVVCRDCQSAAAAAAAAGFHCCAHDAVTEGFRSQAGPIARPIKETE